MIISAIFVNFIIIELPTCSGSMQCQWDSQLNNQLVNRHNYTEHFALVGLREGFYPIFCNTVYLCDTFELV